MSRRQLRGPFGQMLMEEMAKTEAAKLELDCHDTGESDTDTGHHQQQQQYHQPQQQQQQQPLDLLTSCSAALNVATTSAPSVISHQRTRYIIILIEYAA